MDIKDDELRRVAELVADRLLETAGHAANEVTHTAAITAADLNNDSSLWKWLLGAIFTIVVALAGTAYGSLVHTDEALKAELTAEEKTRQEMSNILATLMANQSTLSQTMRDNGTKIDSILQKVYSK